MGYRQALTQYIDATNTHQFDNVKELLDVDAVYWFPNKTCTTIEEIGAYFERTWQTIEDEVYRATNVEWIAVGEDMATCLYIYKWRGYYKGELREGSGRATNVLKKVNGEWKFVHEHLSPYLSPLGD